MSASSFTDRMHRKHWSPDIHSSNTDLGKEWANGGAARPGKRWVHQCSFRWKCRRSNLHVISDFKFLFFSSITSDHLLQNEGRDRIRGIALFGIGFDDDAAIYDWTMICFMLRCVVGVDSVGHITGQ